MKTTTKERREADARRRCRLCNLQRRAHLFGCCADGRPYVTGTNGRISMSFAADEVAMLKELCINATRGKGSGYLTQTVAFARIMRKSQKTVSVAVASAPDSQPQPAIPPG